MDLSIIIVSWNVRDLLSRLLDSIFQYTDGLNYEVIVIDNQSNDGTVNHLENNFTSWKKNHKLKLITNDYNAGFSKANNQGLAAAQGKYILFMNPDMEITENSFLKLKNFMDKTPNAGACTCRLVYGDKSIQPNIKSNPGLCDQLFVVLKIHHFFKWLPCLKKYLQKNFDYTKKQYVKQMMGAFIFTRHDLIAKTNGWDEDYWLWWEDLQLCKDLQKEKVDLIYLPITEVVHYEGQSFAQYIGLKKQKRFNKGLLTYFKKNKPGYQYWILYILQPVNIIFTLITQIFKIKPRTQSKI